MINDNYGVGGFNGKYDTVTSCHDPYNVSTSVIIWELILYDTCGVRFEAIFYLMVEIVTYKTK